MNVENCNNSNMITETLHYCIAMAHKMCIGMLGKMVVAVGLGVFTFMFDVLQKDALIALLILIAMDTVTGMYGAYKVGEEIESRKFAKTSVKIAVYFLMVSAGFLAEKAVPIGFIDDTIIAFLAITELISMLENVAKAGYAVPKRLLNKLKDLQDDK